MTGSSSSTAVLVAGSALIAAGIGYFTIMQSSNNKGTNSSKKGSSNYELNDIEDEVEEELIAPENLITADEIVEIFDKLFLELQGALASLMQQIQQVQMTGQVIPDKQIKEIIREQLLRVLDVKQYQIIEEQHNMDVSCCEEATWEFIQDGNVQVTKVVDRFQRFWENATDEPVTGWRPGQQKTSEQSSSTQPPLSPEEVIHAAEVYFASLTDCMKTIIDQYKLSGKNLQDPMIQQELNMDFSTNLQDAGEEALGSIHVTLNQFESAVKLHSNNPTVARALGMLSMKHQQEMMQMS